MPSSDLPYIFIDVKMQGISINYLPFGADNITATKDTHLIDGSTEGRRKKC